MIGEIINIVQQGGGDLVQAVADVAAARKVIQVGGQTIDIIRGYIGHSQEKNLKKIGQAAVEQLAKVDVDRVTEPSPSLLTPLIEAACQESREELQKLWAALLANAMIDNAKKVRREYLDVAKKLEPVDVTVLNIIRQPLPVNYDSSLMNSRDPFYEDKRDAVGLGSDEWFVSVRALTELGCVAISQTPILTPFGRMFLAACEVA